MKLKNVLFIIGLLFLISIYLYILDKKQMEDSNVFLDNYKKLSQENYDRIYSENYKTDYESIVMEEEEEKVKRIKVREDELIREYWRQAKSQVGQQIGVITQEFPEVFTELVVKDAKAGHYTGLQDYLNSNYPNSRLASYNIIGKCKEYGASPEQCALMLAVAGVESSMDTNYVTHWRERDVVGGQQRNNLWGLKMNRRYADLKGLDYVSKPPYDNYSFVAFTTLDSGIKYFLEFLKIEYKGASQPSHLFPYFNGSQSWLNKANKFYDIILPLIKY